MFGNGFPCKRSGAQNKHQKNGLWRYQQWTLYCTARGLPQYLDINGSTPWGSASLAALDATTLPGTLPNDTCSQVLARHHSLTKSGVLRLAKRVHGRLYHPTTNLPKTIRRASNLAGEPAVELDMHAAYTCILASMLPDSESRNATIAKLQLGNWYDQFEAAYLAYLTLLETEDRVYTDADGAYRIRGLQGRSDLLASIKVEYQRQCLFWVDNRAKENPLRRILQDEHRELSSLISRHRRRETASDFSKVLMEAEGALIVNDLMPALSERGILVQGIHDGIIVPVSFAVEAKEIMQSISAKHLGFIPHIASKGSTPIP